MLKRTTPIVVILLSILAPALVSSQPLQQARVVSGYGYSFRAMAPVGWRFYDEDPAVLHRLDAYFVPVIKTIPRMTPILHVTAAFPARSGVPDVRAWINGDIASIASSSPPLQLEVTELPLFPEDGAHTTYVVFDDRVRSEFHAVAYRGDAKRMFVVSLDCRDQLARDAAIPSLRELVRSLEWVDRADRR